jgi:hypothetical protein
MVRGHGVIGIIYSSEDTMHDRGIDTAIKSKHLVESSVTTKLSQESHGL